MKEQIVGYEVAQLAKKCGFDIEYKKYYGKDFNLDTLYSEKTALTIGDFSCYAPTQSLLQKWIREKYFINIYPSYALGNSEGGGWSLNVNLLDFSASSLRNEIIKTFQDIQSIDKIILHSYEEALEMGLKEILKLIKI